jgi:hypothetical protein
MKQSSLHTIQSPENQFTEETALPVPPQYRESYPISIFAGNRLYAAKFANSKSLITKEHAPFSTTTRSPIVNSQCFSA